VSPLLVWKNSELVGRLSVFRSGLRFEYAAEAIERRGLGLPVVSMSLVTSAKAYPDKACRPFFDGLLPEGEARRIIAYDLGIAESDTFGLLEALGRDCAGALLILPAGREPGDAQPVAGLNELHREEIDALVANLRFEPFGLSETTRVSLGGVQQKLLLTALADGRWALPTTNVASTHILKPAVAGLTGNVENEAVCLRFAGLVGARSASVDVAEFGGRHVLVVERFDRFKTVEGRIRRVHQETACQALGVPVGATARKYEDAGGPSLAAVAGLLTRWSIKDQLEELLRQVAVNVLVGNADAHAMNVSFILGDDGFISLAPMYDVFSTLAYPQLTTTPGMFVDGIREIRDIGRANLVNEAVKWGLSPARAHDVVAEVIDRSSAALDAALTTVASPARELGPLLHNRITAVASPRSD
jgi:serine/threonine-protein kinase HipA